VRDYVAVGGDEEMLPTRLDGEDLRARQALDGEAALVGGDHRPVDEERAEREGVPADRVAFRHQSALTTRLPGATRRPRASRRAAASGRSAGTPLTGAKRSSRWRRRPARWRSPSTPRSTPSAPGK